MVERLISNLPPSWRVSTHHNRTESVWQFYVHLRAPKHWKKYVYYGIRHPPKFSRNYVSCCLLQDSPFLTNLYVEISILFILDIKRKYDC